MPPRGRKPRTNPLIPAPSASKAPIEQVGPAPICGVCWPDGWPEGGDYASCEHGEWSTTEGLVKRSPELTYNDARRAQGLPPIGLVDDGRGPYVIDGVTTDGTAVKVTIRPGEPALISLSDVDLGSVALTPPLATVPSPFAPKPAPTPVPIEPEELDTGDDVMFMPSGG